LSPRSPVGYVVCNSVAFPDIRSIEELVRSAPPSTEIWVNPHLVARDSAKLPDLVQARLRLMSLASTLAEFLASRLPEEPEVDHSFMLVQGLKRGCIRIRPEVHAAFAVAPSMLAAPWVASVSGSPVMRTVAEVAVPKGGRVGHKSGGGGKDGSKGGKGGLDAAALPGEAVPPRGRHTKSRGSRSRSLSSSSADPSSHDAAFVVQNSSQPASMGPSPSAQPRPSAGYVACNLVAYPDVRSIEELVRSAPSTTEIWVNPHLAAWDCTKLPDLVQARLGHMSAATSFAEFLASRLPEEPEVDHSFMLVQGLRRGCIRLRPEVHAAYAVAPSLLSASWVASVSGPSALRVVVAGPSAVSSGGKGGQGSGGKGGRGEGGQGRGDSGVGGQGGRDSGGGGKGGRGNGGTGVGGCGADGVDFDVGAKGVTSFIDAGLGGGGGRVRGKEASRGDRGARCSRSLSSPSADPTASDTSSGKGGESCGMGSSKVGRVIGAGGRKGDQYLGKRGNDRDSGDTDKGGLCSFQTVHVELSFDLLSA
jgi:hypothetical protein